MYKLIKKTKSKRTYQSQITETQITTSLIYTDGAGKKWWGFDDLMAIPFIRKKTTDHITQLYSAGVTRDDLNGHLATMKKVLKSVDPDKYEKAFAEVLRVENIMNSATDPVKQMLGLCTVYILADDEQVDTYDAAKAAEKMGAWTIDPDAQAFFLNWLTDGMNNYTGLYALTMPTALNQATDQK